MKAPRYLHMAPWLSWAFDSGLRKRCLFSIPAVVLYAAIATCAHLNADALQTNAYSSTRSAPRIHSSDSAGNALTEAPDPATPFLVGSGLVAVSLIVRRKVKKGRKP